MRSPDNRITVMTTTNELYLPTRLVYEVFDVKPLRAWLQKTSCVAWNPIKRGWTWNYDGAVRKMKFRTQEGIGPRRSVDAAAHVVGHRRGAVARVQHRARYLVVLVSRQ